MIRPLKKITLRVTKDDIPLEVPIKAKVRLLRPSFGHTDQDGLVELLTKRRRCRIVLRRMHRLLPLR